MSNNIKSRRDIILNELEQLRSRRIDTIASLQFCTANYRSSLNKDQSALLQMMKYQNELTGINHLISGVNAKLKALKEEVKDVA